MKENPITASTTTPALDPTAHHDNHSHPPVSLAPIKIFHHQHQEKNYHYWSTGTSRLHYFLHIASAPPSTQIKSNPLGWQKDREGENLYHIKSAAFSVGARTEEERTLFTRLEGKELLIPPLAYCTVCNGKGPRSRILLVPPFCSRIFVSLASLCLAGTWEDEGLRNQERRATR